MSRRKQSKIFFFKVRSLSYIIYKNKIQMLRNKIKESEGDKHIHLILKWERPLNKGGSLKILKEVHEILNLFKGRIYYK